MDAIHTTKSAVIWGFGRWPLAVATGALLCCIIVACDRGSDPGTTVSARESEQRVTLKNAQGETIGTAILSDDSNGGVQVRLDVRNLQPGRHAFHIHQFARCEPPTFASAGPHFNPDGKKHGLENPEGPHAGDMDNFTVSADGTAKVTFTDDRVSLRNGPGSVFTAGGTALVIHAKADDMKTDPSGDSGDRIACGEILHAG